VKGLKVFSGFLVAHFEASVVSEPNECAFNDVSETPQAAAVRLTCLALAGSRHQCQNATFLRALQVGWRAVGGISLKNVRAAARAADRAADGWDAVQHFKRRNRVVDVGCSGVNHQRQPIGVCNQMPLAAVFRSVSRVRTGVIPPKTARTDWLSITARCRSISPLRPSRFSRRRCTSGQTPALVQSRSRRQHVTPLPQPSSFGSMRQAAPVRSTNTMPTRASRFETMGRPPLGLGGSCGRSGSISFQNSSGTNEKAMEFLLIGPPHNSFRHFSFHTLGF